MRFRQSVPVRAETEDTIPGFPLRFAKHALLHPTITPLASL
jgi:hypothetical protein